MNRTYSLSNEEESVEIRMSKPSSNEDSLYGKRRGERKMRLNKLKERTKMLLKNHNWEKYFQPGEENNFDDSLLELVSNDSANLFARSISAINRLEYDTLLQEEDPQRALRNNEDLFATAMETKFEINLMPLLLNTSKSINKDECTKFGVEFMNTPPALSSTKRKLRTSTGSSCTNQKFKDLRNTAAVKKMLKPTMVKQQQQQQQQQPEQSLTFIADLAQTSTPTRKNAQPITSTPKVVNHDPLKYHPTHTIRNKQKQRKGTAVVASVPKRQQFEQELLMAKFGVVKKHKTISSLQKGRVQFKSEQQSESGTLVANCVCCREHHVIQSRKRTLNESLVSSTESDHCMSEFVSTIIQSNLNRISSNKIHKQKVSRNNVQANENNKRSTRIKFKTSNIEISLEDFLYTPSKIAKLDLAPKPKMKSVTSKIYYL